MKARFAKMAGVLLVGLTLTFGTAVAQSYPTPPASECTANGDLGMVELRDGQRHFLCWDGQWQFLYERTYSGNSCVIH